MSLIVAKNIHKTYHQLEVLKGINLTIDAGEVVSIVGASGAGKTTLLQIIGTLDYPDKHLESKLSIDQLDVLTLKDNDLSKFRNEKLGFIFQFHQLLPEFTAIENIIIPGLIGNRNQNELEKKAKELLLFLGLTDRAHHKPNALSGGEQQRIAIARALINNPKLILADEPTGNLDTKTADQLHGLFFKLREEFGQTFIIVTHNPELADMADRKLTMKDGLIV